MEIKCHHADGTQFTPGEQRKFEKETGLWLLRYGTGFKRPPTLDELRTTREKMNKFIREVDLAEVMMKITAGMSDVKS